MTGTVVVHDPTAPFPATVMGRQARVALDTLKGKVVGFVDNTKPNFHHLVDDLAGLLESRYGVARTLKRRKRAPSIPAPDDIMNELAAACDLVICGSGD